MAKTQNLSKAKGIYLLPNLLTLSGLFCAYYAIIAAEQMDFIHAAIAIFIAMLMDAFDGRVARLTSTQTEFGGQLDSLSDMVSFGAAPALVMFSWSLSSLGKLGWLISFLYAVAVALRLARFNTQLKEEGSKTHFQGLACPPAAGFLMGLVWFGSQMGWQVNSGTALTWSIAVLMIAIALLQVSNVPYRSFKEWGDGSKVPFSALVVFVFVLVLIAIDPAKTLFFGFAFYIISGLVLGVLGRAKTQDTDQDVVHDES